MAKEPVKRFRQSGTRIRFPPGAASDGFRPDVAAGQNAPYAGGIPFPALEETGNGAALYRPSRIEAQ